MKIRKSGLIFTSIVLTAALAFTPRTTHAAFSPATNYSVGRVPSSVFSADLNGDGSNDLVTANFSSNNISVLLNTNDGTFKPAVSYRTNIGTRWAYVADLDGDRDMDIAAVNITSGDVSILMNRGDGVFESAVQYLVAIGPRGVTVADLDADGDQDIASVSQSSRQVSVLINGGHGTFKDAVNYDVGSSPRFISFGDLNGDRANDLVTANFGSDSVSVLFNRGDGTFAGAVDYAAGDGSNSVSVVDVNRDRFLDIVVSNFTSDDVSVLFNKGDGVFTTPENYGAGDGPSAVFSADLDDNGTMDLAVSDQNANSVLILLNDGKGVFTRESDYPVGTSPSSVFVADFDNDDDKDLALSNLNSNNVSVLLNDANDETTPPPGGSSDPIVIPKNIITHILPEECTTDRRVRLLLHAHNATEVKISNLPDLSDASWEPYDAGEDRFTEIDWVLTDGDGEKTVYVLFKAPRFELLSEIQTTKVLLDQATLCHTADEHAHILDAEGHLQALETAPECLSDYEHARIEPYIPGTDVRVTKLSDTETQYGFEDANDGSYDDIVVNVKRSDQQKVIISIAKIRSSDMHDIMLRIEAADRGTVADELLWQGISRMEPPKSFDLATYPQLCQSALVPHPHSGDLFQSPSSHTYYLGADGQRHAFPNEEIFMEWFSTNTEVLTVAGYQLSRIPLGGNVTLRPGTLVRIMNDLALYVVDVGQQLRMVVSETFLGSFGSAWEKMVRIINPTLVTNYVFGYPILSGSDPVFALLNNTSTTINDLWPSIEDDHAPLSNALEVRDGYIVLENAPYHTGDVEIHFRILDKNRRSLTAEDLHVAHGKRMHLLIAREDLGEFQHIHPEEIDDVWSVQAHFTEEGHYYLYADIAPEGESPVVLRSPLAIGDNPLDNTQFPEPDPNHAANDNPYRLELLTEELPAGQETLLTFQLTKDGKPYPDLQPWLEAYGHLVMFQQGNWNSYLHTHPLEKYTPDNGKLNFIARFPVAGRYTIFVQLNTDGMIRTFPITFDVPTNK